MKKVKFSVLLIILMVWTHTIYGQVAIVVNKNNPVNELTQADVQAYFKAAKKHWNNGKAVKLVVFSLSSAAGKAVLDKIYGMSEQGYKKFWLQKVFKGDAKAPKQKNSVAEVVGFVASEEGALGFIPADQVSEQVKVLKIDGKKPGEGGYPY